MQRLFLFLAVLGMVCQGRCLGDPVPSADLSATQVASRCLDLLDSGKQADAEGLLDRYAARYGHDQHIAFLAACCIRSRFEVKQAARIFVAVVEKGSNTVDGQCASYMLALDADIDVDHNFDKLRTLVEANPQDLMLRWMIAVECRNYHRNEEGVRHYQKILAKWNPGPVLVHQTYANLLGDLNRHEEELAERRKSVALEPASWNYKDLGSTLCDLKRFPEAEEAYAKAAQYAPDDPEILAGWGWALLQDNHLDKAIAKSQKAATLDPHNTTAWINWGACLEEQGKYAEAIALYQKAIQLNPGEVDNFSGRIANDQKWMSEQQHK